MTTETKQLVQETEEQVETPVSQENESVSQDTTEGETDESKDKESVEEVITFKNKVELAEHIKSEANSIANKSTAPLQSDNDKLKTENTKLLRQLEYKAEDTKLSKLEAAELAELPNTEDVRQVQDVRSSVIKKGREQAEKEQELTLLEERLTATGLRQSAFEKALQLFLPKEKDFISQIEGFATKLQEAKTEREMELIFDMEESKIKTKAESSKTKRPPPDKNPVTSPGSKNESGKSPREMIEAGLKKIEGEK